MERQRDKESSMQAVEVKVFQKKFHPAHHAITTLTATCTQHLCCVKHKSADEKHIHTTPSPHLLLTLQFSRRHISVTLVVTFRVATRTQSSVGCRCWADLDDILRCR